jgi:hypothetical protein
MDATLQRAVIRRVGRDSLQDVANHGADAGYAGFTYYTDTCAFYAQHQTRIARMVEEMADDLGETPTGLVKGFRCLNGDYTESEIGRTLYGPRRQHDTQIANALAWFALEEVARAVTEAA